MKEWKDRQRNSGGELVQPDDGTTEIDGVVVYLKSRQSNLILQRSQ